MNTGLDSAAASNAQRPLIAITAESQIKARDSDTAIYYQTMQKYVLPVVQLMGGVPLLLPPLADQLDLDALLPRIDGVLVTGAVSNLAPHHYGGEDQEPDGLRDPLRDHTVLRMLPKIVDYGMPLFAICRGFQELNVAYGGSLHQAVYELPEYHAHHGPINFDAPMASLYADAHDLHVHPGGLLEQLVGLGPQRVNSIHGQGLARLGKGLLLEASAADNMPEALSVKGARNFALAVQWHPEWQPHNNPLYMALWQAFAEACRANMSTGRRL